MIIRANFNYNNIQSWIIIILQMDDTFLLHQIGMFVAEQAAFQVEM